MDNKDFLGRELKSLMEDESKEVKLSDDLFQKIINSKEKTWRDKFNDFLNKEIEIPLAPALVGFAALLAISILPKDIFKNNNIRIIDIGSSQVIVREKEVSRK